MKMRRKATDLLPASPLPITARPANCNPVMRVGAFSEGQSKKAALGSGCKGRVCSGQNQSRKECRSLSRNGNRGGITRPLQSLAIWRCRYTSLSATVLRPRQVTVGATSDPRYGCSVNAVESGSRLSRLRCTSVVALSGGGAMRLLLLAFMVLFVVGPVTSLVLLMIKRGMT